MNLIVGGTGALGQALTQRLRAANQPVRVMTRDPGRAAEMAGWGVEVVQGDLLDGASLARACAGATVVVAAAHAIIGRGRQASVHVDGAGHRRLIATARAAGVRHFIYTSAHADAALCRDVPFFRIKREVEQHLQASQLAHTILRPTAFMETYAHLLIGEPILRKGSAVLFGRGDRARNLVAADDVARVAMQAISDPELAGQTIEIGGPADPTPLDIVRLYERHAGRRARLTHVPVPALRLLSRLLRPWHPGLSQVMLASVLADAGDQRFDCTPMTRRFGFEPLSLETFVAQRFEAQRRGAVPHHGDRPTT